MKLLLAADIFPPESGGPATYVVSLANSFSKEEVGIVSLNTDSDATKVACPVFAVTSKNKIFRYAEYFLMLWKFSKNVESIYAMGPVNAGLPALLVSALRKKRFFVKVVGDYAWEQGVQRFQIKEGIDEFQTKRYGLGVEGLRWVERMVTRRASRVIVPSEYLKKIVEGWGVDTRKIEVIYNAIPFHSVPPRVKPPGEKWVVSVARLVPWKGLDVVIDAVAEISKEIPELKLKIVGDGPSRLALEKKIQDQSLEDKVELVGNIPHEEALSFIEAADVFVLNSAYEGLSHVLLEALHAGVPVLASKSGGNKELIEKISEENLFDYNNKIEIKEKIEKTVKKIFPFEFPKKEKYAEFLELFSQATMIEHTKRTLQTEKILMLSLDNHFLDTDSKPAQRVGSSFPHAEIFILVPSVKDLFVHPHPKVFVFGRGGNKIRQFFSLWRLGRKLNQEEIFSFITTQDPFFTGILGWFLRKKNQSLQVQLHGDFYGTDYYKKSGFKNRVQYSLGKFVLKRANEIRVVGERIFQSVVKQGIPTSRIVVQPVKIDTESIKNQAPEFDIHERYPQSERVFVFLGRFVEVKNLAWLLEVFAELVKQNPFFTLLLIGEGPQKKFLENRVRELYLEKAVHFESWTPNPISILKTADALLFPSLSEGYGMVVIEALAAGCPIIMNDVGVANYELQPSEKVKIIPVENKKEWGQAIASVPRRGV